MTLVGEGSLVVAVCGDAGGASAVAPVITALRAESGLRVDALAYRQACDVWAQRKVDCEEVAVPMSPEDIRRRLDARDVVLLITGTSFDPSLEKEFMAAARELSVPSMAVLDFWSHYVLRFADPDGRLAYLPDRIAVMDERAREEMIALGFDPARIVVTGNPALDDLAAWRLAFTPTRKAQLRQALGVGSDELLVVFCSQRTAYQDPGHALHPGFTRDSVLRGLIAALDDIAERRSQKVVLVVRPHPGEKNEPFELESLTVRVVVSRAGESRDLVLAADLVTGINSTLLIEACHLGCITVSLQPGLRLPDALPTNRSGMSKAVYGEDEMGRTLEELLCEAKHRRILRARLSSLRVTRSATNEILKLGYQMMELHEAKSPKPRRRRAVGEAPGPE